MDIGYGTLLFLAFSLGIALLFECINGFHDTANAVATVIYTKSLKPQVAVIWSGLMNFAGVLLGGIAVAFSIVHLLPVDLLVRIDTSAGMAMVIALLLAAIIWNFGTWFFAIPASSSHTLIGAILGVGLANSFLSGHFGAGINWRKAGEVGLSLFVSPMIGFALAGGMLLLLKRLVKNPALYKPPEGDTPPPWWIRAILILTCTGVSFAHGSNDGQKGIGLIMLILIGLVPSHYALNMAQSREQFMRAGEAANRLQDIICDPDVERAVSVGRPMGTKVAFSFLREARAADFQVPVSRLADPELSAVQELTESLASDLNGMSAPRDLSQDLRWQIRTKILMLEDSLTRLQTRILPILSEEKAAILGQSRATLRGNIEYAPTWVLGAVAVALGGGTMVGWKRIVTTIGEKIGKTHLTYSQGAAAELVAMSTIGLADIMGMPVSTTHVLSSGIAGTMAAERSGLQMGTIRSIALAWILTLPATMLMSAGFFLLFRSIV